MTDKTRRTNDPGNQTDATMSDRGAQRQRANDRERDLAEAESKRAGDNADSKCADDAGAAMKRRHPGRQSNEERQGVDSKGEDQPAEQADPEHAEDESDDEHGGNLRDKGCDGRAFHHHHGATQSIAKRGR